MNAHDSDRMSEVLTLHGWSAVDAPEDADLIVFNTCSVREKAEQKLRSEIGKLVPLKKRKPDLMIAVAGCVAQQEGERLLNSIEHLDLVLGPDNIRELPELAESFRSGGLRQSRTVFDLEAPRFLAASPDGSKSVTSAFVTTMKGCDERCSFCIVPTTRGPERYRAASEIVEEARKWIDAGTKEIVLLGQTVDSFRDPALPPPASDDPDESQFPELLRMLSKALPPFDPKTQRGLLRMRYTSPHPRHATPSLVAAHASLDALAEHIHLPVQSGSDRVLKRMIRRYKRAEFIVRAKALLAARPTMTMSTDIIVGFPGETEEDFQDTLSLVKEVGFTQVFGFKFSPRPFTPALKLGDDVPESVKSDRLERLFTLVDEQLRVHLETLLGTKATVIVEGISKTGDTYCGRTERNEIVHIVGVDRSRFDLTGLAVPVLITKANRRSSMGEIVASDWPQIELFAREKRPVVSKKTRHLQVLAE